MTVFVALMGSIFIVGCIATDVPPLSAAETAVPPLSDVAKLPPFAMANCQPNARLVICDLIDAAILATSAVGTVESSIDPYLPPDWQRGPGFNTKSVKFRHLLTHTSGIGQAIAAMNPKPSGNGWGSMQTVVAGGTVVNSQRQYKNMNFALLQVLNAELYKRSGGAMTQTVPYDENSGGDIGSLSTGAETYTYTVPVTEESHPVYALNYLRKLILEPAGLKGISCKAGDPATEAWSYPLNALQGTNGGLVTASVCGGHMGLRLSSMQHVQLLAHLRHGTIINPADLATMDQLRAGWDEDSNGGDGGQAGQQDGIADTPGSVGAFWHAGDAVDTNQIHTCGATFAGGIQVSLIVNSTIVGNLRPCTIIRNAWNASK